MRVAVSPSAAGDTAHRAAAVAYLVGSWLWKGGARVWGIGSLLLSSFLFG